MQRVCQMADNENIVYSKGKDTVKILTQHWLTRCLRHCLSFFYMRCQADLLLMRFSVSIADILTVVLKDIRLYEDLQHSHPFFSF